MELKDIYNSSATARMIFKALAEKPRDRKVLNLYNFKHIVAELAGKPVSDDNFHSTFEQLHKAGYGKLTKREDGAHSIFIWKMSAKEVARSAIKGFNPLSEETSHVQATESVKHVLEARTASIRDSNNEKGRITLELPLGFSKEDLVEVLVKLIGKS